MTGVTNALEYLPIAAAAFGIPQYLPQIIRLRGSGDMAGVSWSWAALTSVNNAAWFAYFMLSGYWTASLPSTAATMLAGTLALTLARRGALTKKAACWICSWAVLLLATAAVGGRNGLGTLLSVAFVVQVTPSIWTAYRTALPTGISPGTWALVLGELSCWAAFGLWKADPRLIALGATGVISSLLMLIRAGRAHRPQAEASDGAKKLLCTTK